MIDPSAVLRQGLLGLGRSNSARRAAERAPIGRSVVRRFVAGDDSDDAVAQIAELVSHGLLATTDCLTSGDARDPGDVAQAGRTRDSHVQTLRALRERGLTAGGAAEVSLRLSAVGLAVPQDGPKIALDNARQICEAAALAGTTVTVGMEDHTTTDATLDIVRDLRADFPWVGVALQAALLRTEADCRDLAAEGSRVRLCKGSCAEPPSVALQDQQEVSLAFVRCLKVLLAGKGYPMIATHDQDLIDIARSLSDRELRSPDSFEFQMFFGVRPDEQRRLADAGLRMRVYVPYGTQWYPYVMRRLADHPAQAMTFLRSPKG
ncbi:proline dehydrogenase family protein [Flexivirga sp. B27]